MSLNIGLFVEQWYPDVGGLENRRQVDLVRGWKPGLQGGPQGRGRTSPGDAT